MATPSDPLYGQQWHFPLLGDIETIWDEFTGAGVNVGVYDDGFQYTHPDLAGNYDASLHFTDSFGVTHDPAPIDLVADGHGTAVGGLIGAVANNGQGGVGVAHGATLTGVNFLVDMQFNHPGLILESMAWAANFDIMNNSWGRTPSYAGYQNPTNPLSAVAQEVAQFVHISETGRGGLGTVVLQAAGNDTRNANGDGINTSRHTASIAATDANGFATWYTNFGSAILVAAPAGAVTTDNLGGGGYDAGDYTFSFGGTSAATPVTSGVVALMLEANSGLGWRDVQNILAISAAQTGSEFGGPATGFYERGTWFSTGTETWNGGGMTFHQSYGFGMVDAFAATRMAEVWSVMHGAAATSANEQHVIASHAGGNVAVGTALVEIPLTVVQNIEIENIQVTLGITHSWASDLVITLVGPNGEEFVLMNGEGGSTLMDAGLTWQFEVTGALGLLSAGTWTLRIEDTFTLADTGTLTQFTLDFYGSQVSNNDVHHVTDDFRDLAAVEGGRSTISDTNGGTDWLNFAAIQGDLSANLGGGQNFLVAGEIWGTIGGGFENLVAGDGNDTLIGNAAANRILGMRGDDLIRGGGGHDTLEGGAGADRLFGEGGNDQLQGGAGADTLRGGNGNDTLQGAAGADRLFGEGGHDLLEGGIGNDLLQGAGGRDTLRGGDGDDTLQGGGGPDRLFGDGGHDLLQGGGGNDRLQGGGGRDTLQGGAGNDTLAGGGAPDRLWGGDGNDLLLGAGGNDRLWGDGGDDTLDGGTGNDTLTGGQGHDLLRGGGGNDRLSGGAGSDTLEGGTGNDTQTGGGGGDIFVFGAGDGNDRITDFGTGPDRIRFLDVVQYGDLVMTQQGGGVRIDHGAGTVLLEGLVLADISESQFQFG